MVVLVFLTSLGASQFLGVAERRRDGSRGLQPTERGLEGFHVA